MYRPIYIYALQIVLTYIDKIDIQWQCIKVRKLSALMQIGLRNVRAYIHEMLS